ncbi:MULTISPECIES: D-fructose-6-phosphate amidotransferase [Photobacterium]|jgi:hypothetical protein|uniref:D-fructose-6-phosphate amidotransferase n=1 Tax=Photobacterium indicum TaxID=81447 RepID=A0A2T3LEG0_9GAMM|nr:D-fructose-6-phosphate amidotransferase [Photobacterium indicum]PSV49770.1 D-fructose-6-phosphate amidotransferase [Photobacterium indicum]
MDASKVYLRDFLGLILVILSVLALLGAIFDVLAVLNYVSDEKARASVYLHESLPLLICILPTFIIAKIINRPSWIIGSEDYRLMMAKKMH